MPTQRLNQLSYLPHPGGWKENMKIGENERRVGTNKFERFYVVPETATG